MLLFYSHTLTNRLQYTVDFFSRELFNEPIRITTDAEEFKAFNGPRLNYSENDFSEEEFYIKPHGLLFQTGIKTQEIDCFELNFQKAFFATKGDHPFDIFSAVFYLISRYEEYLPHDKDEYGRFSYMSSLAFKEDFLSEPLVNIWLEVFRKGLQKKFPDILFRRQTFRCMITYDIDMAYSYKHKGILRNAVGFMRSFFTGKWGSFRERWQVLAGKKKDPFDCFEWLDALHLYCRLQPYYFFLVAGKPGKYDKNISTEVAPFRKLIEYYSQNYKTGIHPSWQSGDDLNLLREEIEWMEVVTEEPVKRSRQHYIRMHLPDTYQQLIDLGIKQEYSMGYGSINGFRASVASSYLWYDLGREESTGLWVYPFCFMDANALYEQKQSPSQTYQELMGYYSRVKRYNGVFVSIWHNSILGTAKEFEGWASMFELFMRENVYWDAYRDEN